MDKTDKYLRSDDTNGSSSYFENGRLKSQEIVTFNAIGKFLEWKAFDAHGIVEEIRTWQFDENRHILEWGYYHGDGSLNYMETAQYDGRGNRVLFAGRNAIERFTYNEQNLQTSLISTGLDGTENYRYLKEYDDRGNMTLEIYKHSAAEQITVNYYDERNRLVKYEVKVLDAKGTIMDDTDRISWYVVDVTYDWEDKIEREMLYNRHGTYLYDIM